MAYGIQVEVWGDRALFTRPELSVERVSYDVITPSAARGLIESIYWHPGLRYTIDRIHVLNPIRFTNVRRNEVKSKALASTMRTAITSGGELPYHQHEGRHPAARFAHPHRRALRDRGSFRAAPTRRRPRTTPASSRTS